MNRILSVIAISLMAIVATHAQNINSGYDENGFDSSTNTFNPNAKRDSTKQKQEVPKGMYVWRVDPQFGDRIKTDKDTVQHLFMNTIFTSGMHGEYNTTGNLGAPRQNRIFIDRNQQREGFAFTNPLDFFLKPVGELRFTNTLSPMTQLNYYSCGDQTDGEDYFKCLFATNVNKQLGMGFKIDYMYGRGYYQNQATSLFDFTFWTSYIGDRYQAHFIYSTDHLKNTESGGIEDDNYVLHPEHISESYSSNEIPTNLSENWNKNHANHLYLTHRYSLGFSRKVPMTPEEIEAKKFAMQAKKEQEDRERMKAGEVDSKGRVLEKMEGRPDDAVVVGNLPSDSLKNEQEGRIAVASEAVADSLLAAEQKAKEDTMWLKNEYVPVTSFIHTLSFDHYDHTYIAYASSSNYYLTKYSIPVSGCGGDSIYDNTKHFKLQNTFAIALLEGFNKYMKSGLKAFITSDIRHYELPDTVAKSTSYTENNLRVGAQLSTTQGRYFHYNVTGELGIVGKDLGDIKIDGTADVNVPLFGDTVRLDLNGFFHRQTPDFYLRHYHGSHYWWDNDDFNKQTHTHIGGAISYPKTKTALRVAVDNIQDYVYLGMAYDGTNVLHTNNTATAYQTSTNISLFTAELSQDFKVGPLRWENRITYQKSTQQDILPVPALNVWTNLYLDFKIAKVLHCHLGADATYFTEYYAPEYCPGLQQYAVQKNEDNRTKVGNYPFVDVYANFVLKGCRFFVMMSHVTAGNFDKNYFTTAHYPMNERVFRIGISWNFNN